MNIIIRHQKCYKNDVDTKFTKHGKTDIAPILCKLCNACLMQGVFPKCLEVAEVIPVHRKGNKHKATNYRPI